MQVSFLQYLYTCYFLSQFWSAIFKFIYQMKVGTYSFVSLWNVFDFSTKCSYPLSMGSVHRKFNWICFIVCPRFKEKGGILFLLCTSILPSNNSFCHIILRNYRWQPLAFLYAASTSGPIYYAYRFHTCTTPTFCLPTWFYFFKHYLLISEMDSYISME